MPVEDDGLAFDVASLTVGAIRAEQAYGGVRATLMARLEAAQIRLQIDVGFGDAITPSAETVELPTLLDMPAPILRVYPRETVVAEKVEAMCQLGIANSRMKDFYDLVVLSRMFEFDGALLARALRATFANRRTPLPTDTPVALTPTFYDDPSKRRQWQAFLKKAAGEDLGDLPSVAALIHDFVGPVLRAAVADDPIGAWTVGGGWHGR